MKFFFIYLISVSAPALAMDLDFTPKSQNVVDCRIHNFSYEFNKQCDLHIRAASEDLAPRAQQILRSRNSLEIEDIESWIQKITIYNFIDKAMAKTEKPPETIWGFLGANLELSEPYQSMTLLDQNRVHAYYRHKLQRLTARSSPRVTLESLRLRPSLSNPEGRVPNLNGPPAGGSQETRPPQDANTSTSSR